MAETILEQQTRRTEGQEFLSSEDIVGKRVKNPEGYDLGEISSLRIGLSTGRVAYAVLKTGGMFGIGSKLFAIPIEAMIYRPGDDVFVANIIKNKLDNESGFQEGEWPREATWSLIESGRPMGPPSQEEARAVTQTQPTPQERAGSKAMPIRAEEVESRIGETQPVTEARGAAPSVAQFSAADLQVYLTGMNYPAGRQDLVAHARKNNAPDNVIAALDQFSDRTYQSVADVSEEFRKVR